MTTNTAMTIVMSIELLWEGMGCGVRGTDCCCGATSIAGSEMWRSGGSGMSSSAVMKLFPCALRVEYPYRLNRKHTLEHEYVQYNGNI